MGGGLGFPARTALKLALTSEDNADKPKVGELVRLSIVQACRFFIRSHGLNPRGPRYTE